MSKPTDTERLQWILEKLEWDGDQYWFPEIKVKERAWGEDICKSPTIKEFRKFIDGLINKDNK